MIPAFAVVGHPNKGKSSVVSTLARDDSVAVSMRSGTTVESAAFDIHIGSYTYQLIDTPGFQRPRKVLAWLNKTSPTADLRADRVRAFIEDEECQKLFKDEVELLRPIMQGAAILYVVDGSRPYSAEYEAEMEILRWTGQPSMALINPISHTDFVDSWRQALQQFFSIVRVFDAIEADLQQHISLLDAFSHLHLPWAQSLQDLIGAFQGEVQRQKVQSCALAAQLLQDLSGYQLQQKMHSKSQAKTLQPMLQQQYYQWMRLREKTAHDELQRLYQHHQLERESSSLLIPDDLFDTEKWYGWGLDRKQLASVAGVAGAAAGSVVDLAVAGQTFMLGAVSGAVAGSSAAWLGADKLSKLTVKGLPLGGYEARQGPIKSRNFPYVILARFLYLYRRLAVRNHALRDKLAMNDTQINSILERLEKTEKKQVYKAFDALIKQKQVADLPAVLMPLFDIE